MSSNYPIVETAAFYIDKVAAAYILLKYMQDIDDTMESEEPLTEGLRALLETGEFERAVEGEISLEKFKELYPEYESLEELLPEEFENLSLSDVQEILEGEDVNVIHVGNFNGTIETYDYFEVRKPLDISVSDDYIMYLSTKKGASLFKAVYDDLEDVEAEYRQEIGKWFPDDFEFKSRICNIAGTDYC